MTECILSKFADYMKVGERPMHEKAELPFSETWTGGELGRKEPYEVQ